MISMPALVQPAARMDVNPGIGRIIRFTARRFCSTILLRYLHGRIMMAVLLRTLIFTMDTAPKL